jgi:hypothetical protein
MFEVLLVTLVLAVAIDDLRKGSRKPETVGRAFYSRKRSSKAF